MRKSNRVIQVGNIANHIYSTRENPNQYRVYCVEGISPNLTTANGGGRNPYIIEYDTKYK